MGSPDALFCSWVTMICQFCKDIKYWVPFSGLEHLAVEFLIEDILGLLKEMYGSGKGLFSDCCISYVVLVQGYEQHSSNSIVESK